MIKPKTSLAISLKFIYNLISKKKVNTNITNLETVADCNSILSLANGAKAELERKLATANQEQARLTTSATTLDQKISWVTSDLATINTQIAAMPEGPDKESAITKRMRLEVKLRVYTEGIDNYGLVALLEADMEADRMDGSLVRVNAFIAEVEAKKATLPSA